MESKSKVVPQAEPTSANRLVEIRGDPTKYASNKVVTSRYTWYNFIFLNLWLQFHKVANIYFLLIAYIQTVPSMTTTNGVPTNAAPLAFVLGVAAIKDGLEDMRKHKADNVENTRETRTLTKDGKEEKKRWKDIQVGDIVQLKNRELVPADMVLLATSDANGLAYTMTANLDGETNLKLRKAHPDALGLDINADVKTKLKEAATCEGTIEALAPNKNLEVFDTTFKRNGSEKLSLSKINTMMRGCQLRNTEWVIGVIVYTGSETKIQKNVEGAPVKISSFTKIVNKQTLFMALLFFAVNLVAAFVAMGSVEELKSSAYLWGGETMTAGFTFLARFGTYCILMSNMIPISLLVTMDMVKFLASIFIQYDEDMYYEEMDVPCQVRCLDLIEELGMIEHVFSDKTGTLTSNSMDFRKCTVKGISYGKGTTQIARSNLKRKGLPIPPEPVKDENEPDTPNVNFTDDRVRKILGNKNDPAYPAMYEFMLHLALNHDVQPERPDGPGTERVVYSASSPDEGAFVNCAKHFGFYFNLRTAKTVTVNIVGEDKVYTVLHVLEFSSKRKRSSVILESDDGKIILYTKGADNIIKERLSKNMSGSEKEELQETDKHLDAYAEDGLRTLLIAKRDVPRNVYDAWAKSFKEASNSMVDRKAKREKCMDEMEIDLKVLGATAIEDMLQDGVDDTLTSLRQAGVKVWVLTGDKVDTAINIGYACALLTGEMKVFKLCGEDMQKEPGKCDKDGVPLKSEMRELMVKCLEETRELLPKNAAPSDTANVGIVLDTYAIMCIMDNGLDSLLLDIGDIVKSVVCARVSPYQKGEIVKLCRNNRAVKTLAIGDGANDVPMIQKAHVGVGIYGKEGLQAVNNSDFAIGQFRFLQLLMLAHGRWCYRRVSIMIYYMFYKNIACLMPQWFHGIAMHFSGQRMYYEWIHQGFNVFNTGLPIVFGAALDQDVNKKSALQNPRLYEDGRLGVFFTVKTFWWHVLEGVIHGAIVYSVIMHTLGYSSGAAVAMGSSIATGTSGTTELGSAVGQFAGMTTGIWMMGIVAHLTLVWVVNVKLMLQLRHWNGVLAFMVFISVGGYYLEMAMFAGPLSRMDENLIGVNTLMLANPTFWFVWLFCVSTCMLTTFVPEAYQNIFKPRLWNIIMEQMYSYGDSKLPVTS